jgi:hypothetical protein
MTTGYDMMRQAFCDAYDQSAKGKGRERHGSGKDFLEQPIFKLADLYGEGFLLGQAAKKMQEAQRMTPETKDKELLGALVYCAAAIIKNRLENNLLPAKNPSRTMEGVNQTTKEGVDHD